MKIKNENKGFSLVELLVVITIIAILSVVAYTAVGGQTLSARNSKRKQDLTAIQNALELYAIEHNNKYPATATWDADLKAKHMPNGVPVDPSDDTKKYIYVTNANRNQYQLATIEEQEGGNPKAYLIGNSTTPLITGVKADGSNANCSSSVNANTQNVGNGDTDCIPYSI